MSIWLRLTIIITAAIPVWLAFVAFPLAKQTLTDPRGAAWYDVLTALALGIVGPALAVLAIVLAVVNIRPRFTIMIWRLAIAVYIAPLAAIVIAIAIHAL